MIFEFLVIFYLYSDSTLKQCLIRSISWWHTIGISRSQKPWRSDCKYHLVSIIGMDGILIVFPLECDYAICLASSIIRDMSRLAHIAQTDMKTAWFSWWIVTCPIMLSLILVILLANRWAKKNSLWTFWLVFLTCLGKKTNT